MITAPILLMMLSIAGLSYIIGTIIGYDRAINDAKRRFNESK
jgi:hypothetical protein